MVLFTRLFTTMVLFTRLFITMVLFTTMPCGIVDQFTNIAFYQLDLVFFTTMVSCHMI